MRLAIPTLILAVILVLGWRVCSGGDADHLQLTEGDLPAELREGYDTENADVDLAQGKGAAPAAVLAEAALGDGVAPAEVLDEDLEPQVAALSPAPQDGAAPELVVALPDAAVVYDAAPEAAVEAAASPAASLPAPEADAPRLPAVSAADAAKGRTYVVKPGDWLMKIARDQYGDASRAKEIARVNALSEPYQLKPGQELVLP